MSEKIVSSIGIGCNCPECGEKIIVLISKKKAKELYKAWKGRYPR